MCIRDRYSKVPVGKLCTTQHRINEDVVLSLVSEMLKAIAEYAKHDRAELDVYKRQVPAPAHRPLC